MGVEFSGTVPVEQPTECQSEEPTAEQHPSLLLVVPAQSRTGAEQQRLDSGYLISDRSKDYLLDLMAQCMTGRNRMKSLLPDGTRVEHKTGTLNGLTDDVGFITLPNGHRIAVAIFARGGANRPSAIAEAAKTVYDGFLAVVGWPYTAASAINGQ